MLPYTAGTGIYLHSGAKEDYFEVATRHRACEKNSILHIFIQLSNIHTNWTYFSIIHIFIYATMNYNILG
jgi:hypothetical protein